MEEQWALIKKLITDYKTEDKKKFEGLKTVKDGYFVYEYMGVPVRIKYIHFNEEKGAHYASVRRRTEDTWTTCSYFKDGGTEDFVFDPTQLKLMLNTIGEVEDAEEIVDVLNRLEMQHRNEDSLAKKGHIEDEYNKVLKLVVHNIVDRSTAIFSRDDSKCCDYCGLTYNEKDRRLERPWE